MRMRKVLSIVLVMVLVASAVPLAVTPVAAQQGGIPCDDGDNELTKEELVNAILPYMLDEGALTLDNVGDAACVYAYWDGKPKTIKDVFEEDVTVYRPVERIISGFNDIAEVLRVVDAKDKIVGIDNYVKSEPRFFPELSKLPMVTSFRGPQDYEAVIHLHPDVYMPYGNSLTLKREFEEKLPGVAIFFPGISTPSTSESFTNNVTKVGYFLDKNDEAEEFIDWYEGYIDMIESQVQGLSEDEKPRVYIEFWSAYSPMGQTLMCEIAGGRSIFTGRGGGGVKVSAEWVRLQNPEIIVKYASPRASNCGYEMDDPSGVIAQREEIMTRTLLSEVTAVTNESVHLLDMWHFGWGASTLIATAYMAKWFHPDLFEDLDPEAIHQEYLTRFQRVDYDLGEYGIFAYPPIEINGGLAGIPDRYKGQI